jgi:hypothetical protein
MHDFPLVIGRAGAPEEAGKVNPRGSIAAYSIFDSSLYRNLEAKWLFPQEKATLLDLVTPTSESKML